MNPCPRCHTPLSSEEHGDIVMERCDQCGGRFLDPDDLKAILEMVRLPVTGTATRMGVDLTGVNEDAACPHCNVPMEPFNYAGDSGVILDKCHGCGGLWLDKGDLERVLAVVAASEKDIERDMKRFSADLYQAEVRQDELEQRDNRTTDPLTGSIAAQIADSDNRP